MTIDLGSEIKKERYAIQHIKDSIMNYIDKQAKPLTGDHYVSQITGDYVKRLLENKVSQVETKYESTAAKLYSGESLESLIYSPKVSYNSSTTIPVYSKQNSTDPSYVNGFYDREEKRKKKEGYLSIDDSYR